jgi:hypothetical protein
MRKAEGPALIAASTAILWNPCAPICSATAPPGTLLPYDGTFRQWHCKLPLDQPGAGTKAR